MLIINNKSHISTDLLMYAILLLLQVVISGLVNISNRLSQHVEVKVVAKESVGEREHQAVAGSHLSVPSYILDPQHVQAIRFRPWGSNGAWSSDVYISGKNEKDNYLVKVM